MQASGALIWNCGGWGYEDPLTICSQCTLSLPPENNRKSYGKNLCSQGVKNGCIGNESVKK